MRLIDADALIEKCGGWYVDECTESGFIGTLENLLATEPTIQPQSTTGQLDNGARSTAQSTDLIDRGQAIEKFTMTAPQMSVIRIYEAVEILESMPPIQPVATDTNVGDKISKFIDGLEETFAYIREREGGDSVCGLCEYDGAYIGESGDWCNECPGFNRDDCFKLSDKTRKKWTDEIIKALPTAQPEPHEGEWINTNPEYKNGFYNNSYYCSECHDYYTTSPYEMKFCPHCGAKMTTSK